MEPQFLASSTESIPKRLRPFRSGKVMLVSTLLLLFAVGVPASGSAVASGPAASWAEQLAAARDKARAIDAGAVLALVEAQPSSRDEGATLNVRFGFVTPGRGYIWVVLNDTQPARSVVVERTGAPLSAVTPAEKLARFAKASDQVSLSPRDTLRLALAKTDVSDRGYGVSDIALHIDDSVSSETKTLAAWSLNFTTPDGSYGIEYTLDARTGKIVRRGDEDSMCRMK